jgi:hypothetical protein
MTQFGSQIQTAVHVRLATAAALDTCTYSDTTAQIPANQDLGAKLVATAAGVLTVDSVAAAVDDEILVKDQSSTLQNGVYRVRSAGSTTAVWSLERSRQARDSGQFNGMIVTTGPEGTINASVVLLYSGGTDPVIGTDAITYTAPPASGGTTGTGAQVLATSPTIVTPTLSGDTTVTGNLKLTTVTKGIYVKEGTNATMGTVALNGSTEVTVTTNKVTANSRIFITANTVGGTPLGVAYVSSRNAGTSFGIKGAATDTSTVAWMIIEPA